MKSTLRFFALLDLICFALLSEQAYAQIQSFFSLTSLTSVQYFSRSLFLLGWLSIFASFVLLLIPKKTGIVLYYFQVPVRFIYFLFSFGFISLITYFTSWPFIVKLIIPAAIFGECVRLYLTYKIQQTHYKKA